MPILGAMYQRTLATGLTSAASQFPVIFLTGPRQSGKTTLARACFPDYRYVSLEDLQNRAEATDDPRGFLRRLEGLPGVILDEAQHTPDLFSYIQQFVDERRSGPLVLTGSQNFLLSAKISQSLAGRTAVMELLPFSLAELTQRTALTPAGFEAGEVPTGGPPPSDPDVVIHTGFFPPIHDRGIAPSTWLDSYVRTYVERDLRQLSAVGNLETFSRFLGLCAGRAGQLLNASSLGADAGVDHATVRRWLSFLQAGYVVELLRPHFVNYSKRLVKTPKLYFQDTGVLCHLLGIRDPADLQTHPLRGAIFENFVVNELRKIYIHHGQRPPLYFWRETGGREVDVLVDLGAQRLPIEIKAGLTVATDAFRELDRYAKLGGGPRGTLVHGGNESYVRQGHLVRGWWMCS